MLNISILFCSLHQFTSICNHINSSDSLKGVQVNIGYGYTCIRLNSIPGDIDSTQVVKSWLLVGFLNPVTAKKRNPSIRKTYG